MHYTYEVFLRELGARLKQMRKDRGWTLRTMVVDHKFHVTHWQSFENGKAISVRSLLRICDVFDIPLQDLVRDIAMPDSSKAMNTGEEMILAPHAPSKKISRAIKSLSK